MLLSTSYNSVPTVLSNLHHAFTEVAQKSYHYIRSLPSSKQPADKLLISKSRTDSNKMCKDNHMCRSMQLTGPTSTLQKPSTTRSSSPAC